MAKRSKRKKQRSLLQQVCHPDAAGIDIAAEEIVIAIPEGRDAHTVRSFGTFNADLREAISWLLESDIQTVAMESTGNYWVPLYDFLQEAKIEVCLVNARHVKGVPGRKTDVQDAQWLQQLHTAGLLNASFVPDADIRRMRYLYRQRNDLIRFRSAKHFASWLGLCPDNRISGNKLLGSKTRPVKSRLAYQLRMASMTLWRNDSAIGDYCRRMKAKLGKAEGITATAHKLARIIYSLINSAKPYDESVITRMPDKVRNKRLQNLQKQAKLLGMELVAS